MFVSLAKTNLCGETGGRAAGDGLAGDMASENRVDRIEKTGLSSSNWPNEQNPSLGNRVDYGFVALDTLHQLLLPPVETREVSWLIHY